MVRVIFDGSKLSLGSFQQIGGGGPISYFEGLPYQRGLGYFVGVGNQRGAGVGSVLRSIWRYLKPLAGTLKPLAANVGREIGREGLETATRVLNRVVEGNDLKEAVVSEGKEGIRNLLDKASNKLQKGRGKKRKRSTRGKGSVILKTSSLIGKTVPQKALLNKRRLDSLGYY